MGKGVLVKKTMKYVLLQIIILSLEVIFSSLGTLEIVNKDIKYFSMDLVITCNCVCVLGLLGFVLLSKSDTFVHDIILQIDHYMVVFFSFLEVIYVYKCHNFEQKMLIVVEMLVLFVLFDCEASKIYQNLYGGKDQKYSTYVEKPVIGFDKLTDAQKQAYKQTKQLIDARSSKDSFNLALIGEWGSGKTSVIETLIKDYQTEDKYFILKIGTLTLRESSNVAVYVRDYFKALFRRYEIEIPQISVDFLTSIVHILSNTNAMDKALVLSRNNVFFDLEKEREQFTRKVAKLLELSGKKNVLLFIDDMDRSGDMDQIKKLLLEFASIEGIISIISLDKKYGLTSVDKKEGDETARYDEIEKYIHVRIRIPENSHIEYDKIISRELVDSFERVQNNDGITFISWTVDGERQSLFDNKKDYVTTTVIRPNYSQQGKNNILTQLFFLNLKEDGNFGERVEHLVEQYISQTKELYPYFQKMNSTPTEYLNQELLMMKVRWTNFFDVEESDWLMRFRSNAGGLFFTGTHMYAAVKMMKEFPAYQENVKNFDDVYRIYMKKTYPGIKLEGEEGKNMLFPDYDLVKMTLLNESEFASLNQLVKLGDYDEIERIIIAKNEKSINLFLTVLVLEDFMNYMREILNNYRTFKMQLREAEILKINYLDYLFNEWSPKTVSDSITRIKESHEVFKNMNFQVPSVNALFNTILFECFIKSAKHWSDSELHNEKRVFLVNGNKRVLVVVSERTDKKLRCDTLDINAHLIDYLSEDEQKVVINKMRAVWEH